MLDSSPCLGRSSAIADLNRVKLKGFVAWVLWSVVHLFFLIGARNRLAVYLNWVWSWITYGRGRKVWFATSSSLDAKLTLVQQMDLAGIAIWRLGGEDPKNWDVIRGKLVEDPFESQRMLNQVLPEH